jgi:hypothetical protein
MYVSFLFEFVVVKSDLVVLRVIVRAAAVDARMLGKELMLLVLIDELSRRTTLFALDDFWFGFVSVLILGLPPSFDMVEIGWLLLLR